MNLFRRTTRVAFPEPEEVRSVVDELAAAIERFDVGREDAGLLELTSKELTDLFRLVVLGEFNSGKSMVLNALIGEPTLPTGATPTTQVVQLIRYSDEPYEKYINDALMERGVTVPWLREISLVDTPGTNAINREHERITLEFVPRADLVLFITSADRPFTESERAFLERIRDWGKKVILVINKVDRLNQTEMNEVVQFVRSSAQSLLHFDPPIFPVSAKFALDGQPEEKTGPRAGIDALEKYIFETLDDSERIRLKLMTPLGVASRLLAGYRKTADERRSVLRDDVTTIETIDAQVAAFADEIRKDSRVRLQAVENVILELKERGDRFFEETVRFGRLPDLIRPQKVRDEFQAKVLGDVARRIDDEVSRTVDWLVNREGRLWTDIFDYLDKRRVAGDDRMVGDVGGTFGERRHDLIGAVGEATRRVVDGFDRERQSIELASSFRDAIAQTALAQVGALSLGALIVVLVGTAAADVTGVLATGILGGLALFILPRRRDQARKEFRERTDQLRARMISVINDQIDRELEAVDEHLKQAISPYRRFVETERGRVNELATLLNSLDDRTSAMLRRLEG